MILFSLIFEKEIICKKVMSFSEITANFFLKGYFFQDTTYLILLRATSVINNLENGKYWIHIFVEDGYAHIGGYITIID